MIDAMTRILRYARLYRQFVRFSFARGLQFGVDFGFRVVMDCVYYAVQIAFFTVIYSHIEGLAGLSREDIYVFVASYLVLDALSMTFITNNMWQLPQIVNQGALDYHLIRPVSSIFMLSFRDVSAESFVNLIIASSIFAYSLTAHDQSFAPLQIGILILCLVLATILAWMLYLLFLIPVFWLHSADGIRDLYFRLQVLGERPHPIFTGILGRILRTILPFSLLVSYPVYGFLNGQAQAALGYSAMAVMGFGCVVVFAWRRGLKAYTSASS